MKRYAVIMAGGSGTRLWPLSRRHRPKQLLRIVEGRNLIQAAFERLRATFPPEDIHVIALAEHVPAIAEALPLIPRENLIGEPMGRDTANAVALSAALLQARHGDGLMGIFTADQVIRPTDVFGEVLQRGYRAAEENAHALVTFGIKPTEPHTGLGYVQRGAPVSPGVWSVRSFKEKPDLDTARRYVASGEFLWNSGMFVWRTGTILEQLRINLPATHAAAAQIAQAWLQGCGPETAQRIYPGLQRISIDYAVMEKAPSVLVVEAALDWLDVGHWTALRAVLGADSSGNTAALQRLVTLSSENNVFVTEDDHLIAAVGVKDLVVVHSPDATLICHKDQVQRIKDLVAQLEQEYGGRYL